MPAGVGLPRCRTRQLQRSLYSRSKGLDSSHKNPVTNKVGIDAMSSIERDTDSSPFIGGGVDAFNSDSIKCVLSVEPAQLVKKDVDESQGHERVLGKDEETLFVNLGCHMEHVNARFEEWSGWVGAVEMHCQDLGVVEGWPIDED